MSDQRLPVLRWIAAGENRFGVPLLDLTPVTTGVMSMTGDPEIAERAVSWSGTLGERIAPPPPFMRRHECELCYPLDGPLPEGLLYTPEVMEDKWVIAIHDDVIKLARSWTGQAVAIAGIERLPTSVVVRVLLTGADSQLHAFGDAAATFDWILRTHALGELLPLPASEEGIAKLEASPLEAFSIHGRKALGAARWWSPPPPGRPLRSDGAVLAAVRGRDIEALRRLASGGEALDVPGTFCGYTPLHVATVLGDAALVEELCRRGADPNRRDDRGTVAVHMAVVHHAPEPVADVLEAWGADPAAVNDDGFGALHAVAESDQTTLLPWLVARGLDLEARTRHGYTPVQIAAALGNLAGLETLVGAGADLDATSPQGTAREIAASRGQQEAVALIDRLAGRG